MRGSICLAIGLFAVLPGSALTQDIRVGVKLDDPTDGILTSNLNSALRALGDIDVVSVEESPDLTIQGVAFCDPNRSDCSEADSFIVSLILGTPLTAASLQNALKIIDPSIVVPATDLEGPRFKALLGGFSVTSYHFVGEWERHRYEMGIREFVGLVDQKCFERKRLMRRYTEALSGGRAFEIGTLQEKLFEEGDWIC